MKDLENYFERFRNNIIGIDHYYNTPHGKKRIIYNDWIASGRLYAPIEKKISEVFGPYVANTHTETSETGTLMTYAYQTARHLIKKHVNASRDDVLIFGGYGFTGVINKFQRILGLKIHSDFVDKSCIKKEEKPVVFVTHMEHHSNHTSWYETIADVVILKPDRNLMVNLDELKRQLNKYKDRKLKIGAFTACSNVTGVITPYHALARIMHEHGGLCFIDFAASAPYMEINMHPEDPEEKLDAIFFSPHKFLGGPGSSGVMVFDSRLYKSRVPDHPGGGTVDWTNRWGEYKFMDDIELREDGGTPGFLQAIRAALVVRLKEDMGVHNIMVRESQLVQKALNGLRELPRIHILAEDANHRIGVISFYHETIHFNLMVKLLSDRYGIQVRGGCVCAGTYGHFLLNVSKKKSEAIIRKIEQGDLSEKPGWVRYSLHPTNRDSDIDYFIQALKEIIQNADQWKNDYHYNKKTNEYYHRNDIEDRHRVVDHWFVFQTQSDDNHRSE